MENIIGVTSWLKKKILENGGDPKRETLTVIKDRQGKQYFVDEEGSIGEVICFVY